MSRSTNLNEYRDTQDAEDKIELFGEGRVEQLLEDAELVAEAAQYFAAYHDGEMGCVIRLTDNPVLERIYDADYPSIDGFRLTNHARERAYERGFYDDEVLKLAQTGVRAWDEHDGEIDIIVFNRFKDNTILLPCNTTGAIKTVISRQGVDGKLRINGTDVDRPTRNYRKRKQSSETKYST